MIPHMIAEQYRIILWRQSPERSTPRRTSLLILELFWPSKKKNKIFQTVFVSWEIHKNQNLSTSLIEKQTNKDLLSTSKSQALHLKINIFFFTLLSTFRLWRRKEKIVSRQTTKRWRETPFHTLFRILRLIKVGPDLRSTNICFPPWKPYASAWCIGRSSSSRGDGGAAASET